MGLTWVGGDYEIGDAIFFHSHTVHKALPNQSPDRIRLSVDYRYQGGSQPVTEGSLLHISIGCRGMKFTTDGNLLNINTIGTTLILIGCNHQ